MISVNRCRQRRAVQWLLPLTVVGVAVLATPTGAVELVVSPFSSLEVGSAGETSLRLRKLLVPNLGFKSGTFKWAAGKNAWVQQGALQADDKYVGVVQLWRLYGNQAGAQSESLDLFAGGVGVTAIRFKSPKGLTYSGICVPDGAVGVFNMFDCSKSLPVRQAAFGDGEYVVTFTLGSGQKVLRSYYVSGDYPAALTITYPADGALNVPIAPTLTWTAFGAAAYDFIIRDASEQEVYDTLVSNAIDSSFSQAVPAGVLQANTHYSLTIEANAPVVDGGTKGINKRVEFTTAP